MRQIIILSLWILVICFAFCSCETIGKAVSKSCEFIFAATGKKHDDNTQHSIDQINALLSAIKEKDAKKIVSLFSKNTVKDVENLEVQAEELIEYFKGDTDPWGDEWFAEFAKATFEDGKRKYIVEASFDITTTENTYRICLQSCRRDDFDPNSMGLWSVYVILFEDDKYTHRPYNGDDKNTPGINIGIPSEDKNVDYSTEQINALLSAIKEKDAKKIVSLFSKNTVKDVENLEAQAEELIEYFKGEYTPWSGWCSYSNYFEDAGEHQDIVAPSFDITTTENTYRICLRSCRGDNIDPDNVGLWSVYIILLEDDINYDPEWKYWGDGKYTPGINIGIPSVIYS